MTTGKMHVGEVDTSVDLVVRLLAAQYPQWADLPVQPIPSAGTDNAIYRLGADKVVRLPRIDWAIGQAEKERLWLPRLAPLLPLAIPVQIAMGVAGEGYPWPWSVYQWIDGENPTIERLADPCQAASDLAHFITALQQIDTADGPDAVQHSLRGVPLAMRDAATRAPVAAMRSMIDTRLVLHIWEAALAAPEWSGTPVWFHGDMLSGNLVMHQGRLRAVIDWSGLGVGDPACDLMIAWDLFSGASRDVFRRAIGVDDATWLRAQGHVVSQAVQFIVYYQHTNPVGVRNAWRRLDAVLQDVQMSH